jgi:riboflavin kinase / FMN adenylyltransferase
MRVFRGYSRPESTPTVLTLGNFDGVHLGHVALLERAREAARQLDLPLSVLTFEPHPREFFAPALAPARLTTLREKLERFRDLGADQTFVCHFNSHFAALDAEAFIRRVLVEGVGVRHLVIGDDFHFGAGRQGNFDQLVVRGRELGFAVEAMGSCVVGSERVSSSGVREALAAGDMERAAGLLGRPYAIDGRIVHGRKLGRQLGFATANIYIRHNPLPMTGVFAVRVLGPSGVVRQGVANLGIRPTLGGTRPLLEVHIFDFQGDLYGAHLSAEFVHKLRDEMKFPDLSALQAQIAADAAAARAFFRAE